MNLYLNFENATKLGQNKRKESTLFAGKKNSILVFFTTIFDKQTIISLLCGLSDFPKEILNDSKVLLRQHNNFFY